MNDLVKRFRKCEERLRQIGIVTCEDYKEAADRIEQLEAQLATADELAEECLRVAPILAEATNAGMGDKFGIATSNAFRSRLSDYYSVRDT